MTGKETCGDIEKANVWKLSGYRCNIVSKLSFTRNEGRFGNPFLGCLPEFLLNITFMMVDMLWFEVLSHKKKESQYTPPVCLYSHIAWFPLLFPKPSHPTIPVSYLPCYLQTPHYLPISMISALSRLLILGRGMVRWVRREIIMQCRRMVKDLPPYTTGSWNLHGIPAL